MTPLYKILIFESNSELLEDIISSLDQSVKNYNRSDVDFEIIGAKNIEEVLQLVEEDGDFQSVAISWQFEGRSKQEKSLSALIQDIKNLRFEIPIYVFSDDEIGMDIVEESDYIESFFYRNDIITDPDFIMGYILNDFDDRTQTPFWTPYKKYVIESNDSWHTPGHSGGSSFRNSPYIQDFYNFYGRNVFASDLSISVDSLGSLSDSSNLIGKAQEAAAYTFNVMKTYFVTNGSSTSNKIVLQSLLRSGDKVIADRNCHKSVHYGILQACGQPIYLDSIYDSKYGFFAPPKIEDIRIAIEENPDAKLIVLTGATYEGILTDIRKVVELAHAKGIKVFIDEAWFAYSLFHPKFRYYSAIDSGADYITHSAHKVVSAFSQASYIHVNDEDFDEDFFREIYSIYTSTSPKYQIIASLDVCHKQLEMEGYKIINNLLASVQELKEHVDKFKRIRILDEDSMAEIFPHFKEDNLGHDPLKIMVDFSACDYSIQEIHRFLNDEIGLEIEKYTQSTMLVLLTLGGTKSKVVRLFNALKKLDEGKVQMSKAKAKKNQLINVPKIDLAMLPSKAFFGKREAVGIEEAENRISAGLITPYPPGIPAIVPGQKITKEHIQYINQVKQTGITIQGLFDGEIYVLSDSEIDPE
ncbi:MAG: aminotransferase class V-fold PLP-dependent enzyme [Bdellovibrionota bacterium]|nr:aminotransferase class V-fold PLP-dependent enzyme [Bdellovibrionota bacterium]